MSPLTMLPMRPMGCPTTAKKTAASNHSQTFFLARQQITATVPSAAKMAPKKSMPPSHTAMIRTGLRM